MKNIKESEQMLLKPKEAVFRNAVLGFPGLSALKPKKGPFPSPPKKEFSSAQSLPSLELSANSHGRTAKPSNALLAAHPNHLSWVKWKDDPKNRQIIPKACLDFCPPVWVWMTGLRCDSRALKRRRGPPKR